MEVAMKDYNVIDEFIELAMIDAPSLGERKIADLLTERLKELGFSVHEDDTGKKVNGSAGNLIAHRAGDVDRWLLLSAHMDRVDKGLGIKPQIKDGWIVSDGTTILAADDLSGVAPMLDGIRRAIKSGRKLPNIEVVLSVCEEKGILGARTMDVTQLKSKEGYIFDCEFSPGYVMVASPYKAMITVEIRGLAAHAGAAPEKGINAIMAAAELLSGLRDGRLDEESTSNFGVIHGGNVEPHTVCDYVIMKAEARSHDLDKLNRHLDYMRKHFEENIKKTKATYRMDAYIQHPGFRIHEDDEIFIKLKEAMARVGVTPKPFSGNFGTDGNVFFGHGVKCLPVATSMYNPHSLTEKASVEELILSGLMIEQIISIYGE